MAGSCGVALLDGFVTVNIISLFIHSSAHNPCKLPSADVHPVQSQALIILGSLTDG